MSRPAVHRALCAVLLCALPGLPAFARTPERPHRVRPATEHTALLKAEADRAAARTPADQANTSRVLLRERLLHAGFAAGATAAATAAPGDPPVSSDLVATGDLDGAGGDDTVEVTYAGESPQVTSTLRGRRGRDGAELWHADLNGWAVPIGARVGASGAPGLLVATVVQQAVDLPAGVVVAEIAALSAYDGKGARIWTRPFPHAWTVSPAGLVLAGSPVILGVFDALPGQAADVLIGPQAFASGPAWRHSAAYQVVSGADGVGSPLPLPETAGSMIGDGALVYPSGDLSGDGLADVVYVATNAQGAISVTAIRPADSTLLWTVPFDGVLFSWVGYAGDATGDRKGDLTIESGDYDEPAFSLLSGADGAAVWSRPGFDPEAIGDLNGDHRADLRAILPLDDDTVAGFAVVGYTSAGKEFYRRTVAVPGGYDSDTEEFWGYAFDAGDVQGDGVRDTAVSLAVQHRTGQQSYDVLLDGRSGRLLLVSPNGRPARRSVDGRGDDYIELTDGNSHTIGVALRQGSTGRVLWRTTVDTVAEIYGVSVSYGAIDGDRCTDLVVRVDAADASVGMVLRGRDGRPAWGYRLTSVRSGPLAGVRAGRDDNPGC